MSEEIEETDIIYFKVDRNTDINYLHEFIINYLSFSKVMELYKLLRKDVGSDKE